jgi:hypothetical protein
MTPADAGRFRHDPSRVADEREMYQGWLDFHLETLLWKGAGLSDDQLKIASVSPSSMTLIGLLRHMAEVERWRFRTKAAGLALPDLYTPDDEEDGDFGNVGGAVVEHDVAAFTAECLAADEAVREMSLDAPSTVDMARSRCAGSTSI